jgi:hypothetical protein
MNKSHSLRFGATRAVSFAGLIGALASACGGGVDSDEAARAAYIGLDEAVEKSLRLGFDGFNAASSANIPDQMTTGSASGTLLVGGQVDQGASDNKEMRLDLTLTDYRDELPAEEDLVIVYATNPAAPPSLDLSFRGLPNATFTGTLIGDFAMSGDLEGNVTLNLTLEGMTDADPMTADNVVRLPGTTVRGTAVSESGTYTVDVTI